MGGFAVTRPRRALLLSALTLGAALVAFALWWFQPQKLFIDTTVVQAAPTAADGTAANRVAAGAFTSGEHHTTGSAHVLRLSADRTVVRLVDLHTSNGPAVHVWLSAAPSGASNAKVDGSGHVDLGGLQGNIGSQNYPVPAGVDVATYRSVVIWCSRFHVAFGSAPLKPAL